MAVEPNRPELDDITDRLTALRDELREEIATERGDVRRLGESQDAENESQHPADVGSDLFMQERALSTLRALRQELSSVEAALERAADGKYGICVDCERPIGADRIQARPQAIRCIECERQMESSGPVTGHPTAAEN